MEPTTATSGSNRPAADEETTRNRNVEHRPAEEDSIEGLQAALESARARLQQRLMGEVEQHRAEAERLKTQVEQLRSEAENIIARANETAGRIVEEARQTQARTLEQTQRQVDELMARLRDKAGSFLERAATEIGAVQEAIASAHSPGTPAQDAPPTAGSTAPAQNERIVTRLIVKPAVAPEARARLRQRLAAMPGVEGVIPGAADDESFEMLLAHDRSVSVRESLLALGSGAIKLRDQRDGILEIELANVRWLESAASANQG